MRTRFQGVIIAASISCLALSCSAISGQEFSDGDPGDSQSLTVIARVGDVDITGVDVAVIAEKSLDFLSKLSAEERAEYLLQTAIDLNLMALAARDMGLESDELYQRRLAFERARLLQEMFVQKVVDQAVSESALQDAYEEYRKDFVPVAQRRFSHILADSEKAAEEILLRIRAGEDFGLVGKEMSVDPSAQVSTDIGYMKEGDMIAPLSDAGFSLELPGDVTLPIATQFGWHILKFEEARESAPSSFEEMRAELEAELVQTALAAELTKMSERYGAVVLGGEPAN